MNILIVLSFVITKTFCKIVMRLRKIIKNSNFMSQKYKTLDFNLSNTTKYQRMIHSINFMESKHDI